MHGLVVNVRAESGSDVVSIAGRFPLLAEVFLLVHDKVFGTCHYTLALDAFNRGCNQSSSQIWIGTKSFLELCQIGPNL